MPVSVTSSCKQYAARKVCPLTGLNMMHITVGIQCGAQQQWTFGQEVGQEVSQEFRILTTWQAQQTLLGWTNIMLCS